MKKLYHFGAATIAVTASLAAIGAGVLIVATGVVIGGMLALSAKLASRSIADQPSATPQDEDLGFEDKATS
ncbi:hypothetical protein LGT41_0015660 [Abyssibius alkaniclasticus]|uniref:hypothetical protein n=1 Tax=Abyssibius alkaniclasticus TaxID=2881234 RepID=UPI00236372E2|nr:hypothetical protein [Abyssibius alkaniclasticus]UPH71196.1 hypothetical protein LGT41_0015660 [Abyssibius alkaniclasticus]